MLVGNDIDDLIISFIFNGNNKKNSYLLNKIYDIFKYSNYHDFIRKCRNHFFKIEFKAHDIDVDRIEIKQGIISKKRKNVNLEECNKIHILLQKITKKNNPHFYECYTKFYRNLGNQEINFQYLNRRSKLIIKFLCLYYGYIMIETNVHMFHNMGYTYWNFHDKAENRDKLFTYRFLRNKRIHELEYYDLVENHNNPMEIIYKLKKDVPIYKVGATNERYDVSCIKVL